MRFSAAMKMADYWSMEPPFSYLYYVKHFKANEDDSSGLPPGMKATPYHQLAPALQYAVRRTWLKRNPSKTEADFFAAQKAKTDEKYADKLAEARKAKCQTTP